MSLRAEPSQKFKNYCKYTRILAMFIEDAIEWFCLHNDVLKVSSILNFLWYSQIQKSKKKKKKWRKDQSFIFYAEPRNYS